MSWLSKIIRGLVEPQVLRGELPNRLNRWQEAFCEWNAERLGITLRESRDRFHHSWAALPEGHRGRAFKRHAHVHLELCRPFWSNTKPELPRAYAAHEPLQFLRLLSYDEPSLSAWPELHALDQRAEPQIVDFGCGLAHLSTVWAEHLQKNGRAVKLCLVDLPLLHVDFLRWLCQRWNLPATLAVCTAENPIPALPPCDLCVATEVLEHVHNPMDYLLAFTAAIQPGGFLLTNLGDHSAEFLHVSPHLKPLREHLVAQGWKVLRPHRLYQKP
jgi:SAM-dependent methyltransferase